MRAIVSVFVSAALLCLGASSSAQEGAASYPSRAVRLVVPWPAGGTTDLIARLVAQKMAASLGQPVVVDNIAGAGGNVGTSTVVRAKPDGYTLVLATSSTNAANPYLYARLGFDPIKDFTPIAILARVPNVLVVGKASTFATFDDLRQNDRREPGKLFYASSGIGSSTHLAGELLRNKGQFSSVHVPFKGVAPALAEVMSGRVAYTFDSGVGSLTESGQLRPLAVAADERLAALPSVPTFKELGVAGMLMNVWFGLAAPAQLPSSIAIKLNAAANQALASPDIAARFRQLGSDAPSMGADEFAAFWQSEVARYAELVKNSGAKAE